MIAKEEGPMVRWADADVRALPDHCDVGAGTNADRLLDNALPSSKRPTRKRFHGEIFVIAALVAGAFANAAWVLFGGQ